MAKLEFVMVGNLIGYQIGNSEIEFIDPQEALEIIYQLTGALLIQAKRQKPDNELAKILEQE